MVFAVAKSLDGETRTQVAAIVAQHPLPFRIAAVVVGLEQGVFFVAVLAGAVPIAKAMLVLRSLGAPVV